MQISRLFQTVYLLLEKGTVTAPELAERFEVSVRTIYRDVEVLSQAGIPIYTLQGKGGGISMSEQFVLNKSLLTDQEQNEILFSLQSLSAARLPDADSVFSKLSRLFRKNSTNWIEVDFSPWGSGDQQKEVYALLKQAILEQTVISFAYLNAVGETEKRSMLPVKLRFKDRAWYAEGYSLEKKAPRTFKITRMSQVTLLGGDDVEVSGLPQALPEEGEASASGEEHPVESLPLPLPRIPLVLHIRPAGASRVVDEFKQEEIARQKDGSYRISSEMPEGEWLLQYLLSYGELLEVSEPVSIRLEMKRRIAEMFRRYSE